MSMPSARFLLRLAAAGLLLTGCLLESAPARERQHHGVTFEKWVRDTFFRGYTPPDYTQKWDIPAAVNENHGHIPINPKAARFGNPVDLGDALRQFDIGEPFWLVIGFWEQTKDGRRIVNITPIRVKPSAWRKLWGPVTRADVERLDTLIKDRSLSREAVRRLAAEMKSRPPFSEAVITFNPKIDWKSQRRLQCSLSFDGVFRHLAPKASRARQDEPELWGVPFRGLIE